MIFLIYLDNAATTKMAPEVMSAMIPYMTEEYGNAGTLYKLGRDAAGAIARAREKIAALFGCEPGQVVFTSGGSEGNSTVFLGLRKHLAEAGKRHIVVSAVEHESVLKAAEALSEEGFSITRVAPDTSGKISPRAVEDAIRGDTGLVSVMYVNNEVGAVNDVQEIGDICRAHGALFHTDCVQAAGQYPIEVERFHADFATVSAHKIHGPKGVGALYVRDMGKISPVLCGGNFQEFGVRGGTENVPGIVGFGAAYDLVGRELKGEITVVSILKQTFFTALKGCLGDLGLDDQILHVNGRQVIEPGKILNLRVDGVDAETLVLALDAKGVCVSAGSACQSHEARPSHVLLAMGLSAEEARSSIRISFSRFNQQEELVHAAETTARCIAALLPEPETAQQS